MRREARFAAFILAVSIGHVRAAVAAEETAAGAPGAGHAVSMCPASGPMPLSHVRPLDPSIGAALEDGIRRSRTLKDLVERVEGLDGLVYMFGGPYRRRLQGLVFRGGMSHAVTVADRYRIIKVTIASGHGDQTIATMGHELRHAIEVLESPEAVDLRSVDQLYERIGFRAGPGVYETDAAASAGSKIHDDLARCR
jgi:hypothetical protein